MLKNKIMTGILAVIVIASTVIYGQAASQSDSTSSTDSMSSTDSTGSTDSMSSIDSTGSTEITQTALEADDLSFLGKREITDEKSGFTYIFYVPDVCEDVDETPHFYWHNEAGVSYSAIDVNLESDSLVYYYFDEVLKKAEQGMPEIEGFQSMDREDIVCMEEDRYCVIHLSLVDDGGEAYKEERVYYLDLQGNGKAVLYEVDTDELFLEPESEPILQDIEKCFGIHMGMD